MEAHGQSSEIFYIIFYSKLIEALERLSGVAPLTVSSLKVTKTLVFIARSSAPEWMLLVNQPKFIKWCFLSWPPPEIPGAGLDKAIQLSCECMFKL